MTPRDLVFWSTFAARYEARMREEVDRGLTVTVGYVVHPRTIDVEGIEREALDVARAAAEACERFETKRSEGT